MSWIFPPWVALLFLGDSPGRLWFFFGPTQLARLLSHHYTIFGEPFDGSSMAGNMAATGAQDNSKDHLPWDCVVCFGTCEVRPDARIFCHTHHHNKQQSHHQNHPGPIWNCPAGHLLCNVCYNTESGASEPCCTCKIPMGSTISLVAKNSDQLFNKIFGSLGQGLHVSFGDVCMLLCPSPSLQPMKSNIHT